MDRPRVFITGNPGSGTTFLFHLFRELGLDPGDPTELWDRNERKGREWAPLVELNREIIAWLGDHAEAGQPLLTPEKIAAARDHFRPRVAALDWPELVKAPGTRFSGHVLWPLVRPDLVVLAWRPPLNWARSRLADEDDRGLVRPDVDGQPPREIVNPTQRAVALGARDFGFTVLALLETEQPYVLAEYPRLAQDFEAVLDLLETVVARLEVNVPSTPTSLFWPSAPERAWRRAVNPDYLGWTARRTDAT